MNIKYNYHQKTLGPRAAHLVAMLYEQNTPIFRLKEAGRILNLNEASLRSFVRKLVNRGVVSRLKPGLYILVPLELGREREYMGNPLIVAREIVGGKDYYLSHGTAMEIHGLVTQPQLVTYVTVTKLRRPIDIMGVRFKFVHSRKNLFFGLDDFWATKQEKVKISNLERTIIDGLARPEYCGGLTEAAKALWMRRQDIKIDRLLDYAVKIHIGAVIRRLGYLLELYNIGVSKDWESLQPHLTETYVRLDPVLPAEGKFLRRWRLRLNVSVEELLTVVKT